MADLFNVQNAFYLGNYALAVSEGASLQLRSEEDKLTRDSLILRAHIGLGQYDLVLSEVNTRSPPALQACKVLASYLSDSRNKELALATLDDWLSNSNINDPTVLVIAATIYNYEGDYEKALKCVHNPHTLEMAFILVTTYIKMNRVDLASKALKSNMNTIDEDATLTQLATAYVALAAGGKAISEANGVFQELIEKFGETVGLLNGLALCSMATGKFDQAERTLLDALGKRSNDAETLINLIVCAQHLAKPKELINRYVSQLKSASPNHPWVKNLLAAEAAFDRNAKRFQQ